MWDQKINVKKKNVVLFVYVIILSLIGPIIFWVSNKETTSTSVVRLNKVERKAKNNFLFNRKSSDKGQTNIQNRLSLGEKILVSADINPQKQAGMMAFAAGDYNTAYTQFIASLQIQKNDPETLIYANNAIAASQNNALSIGVSVPIGGNLNVAKEMLRGVAQAQQEVNQSGGIDGRFIKVQIANDDNNPELAKQIATEFVQDEKIVGVIGHNASNVSIAAAPIYQQGSLTMITPTSSAKNLTQLGDYIFRTTPSTRGLADKLADYVVNVSRKTNIAVCADQEAQASKSFKEEFTWAVYEHGGKINSVKCNFSAPDFDPLQVPSKIISNGADALLIAPSLRYLNQAVEIAQANKGQLPLFGSHTMNTFTTLKQGQIDVNGMILPVGWHPKLFSASPFNKNAQQLWGGAGSWRTAMAYDSTQVFIEALRYSNNRNQLQQIISSPKFSTQGASKSVQFMPSGDRNLKGVLIRVQPGRSSGTGYDFKTIE